ncbi:MAG TPA: TrkA C-terminal domain-containing protein, partial [Chromatiaceae bacterium]|nr:TrkA C-terminal domain-containing protein [Chromatiaceae bacterium]
QGVDLQEIVVPAGSPAAGHQIVDLGLPEEALVVLVTRPEGFVIPQGSTVILAGDKVRILGNAQALQQARIVLTGGR